MQNIYQVSNFLHNAKAFQFLLSNFCNCQLCKHPILFQLCQKQISLGFFNIDTKDMYQNMDGEKTFLEKNQRRVSMSLKGWSLSPKSKQTQNFQLFGQNWTKLGWFGLGN